MTSLNDTATFYQPNQVQVIHLQVHDSDLDKMKSALFTLGFGCWVRGQRFWPHPGYFRMERRLADDGRFALPTDQPHRR